uniref:Uncharacterized protein n=1 Tax=Arundo donax TaxID=35708 RepID=A0A0A9BT65_ARUDO
MGKKRCDARAMVGRVVRCVTVMLALDGCYLLRCKSEMKKTMSAKVCVRDAVVW